LKTPIPLAALLVLALSGCKPEAAPGPEPEVAPAAAVEAATPAASSEPAQTYTVDFPNLDLPTIDGGRYVLAEQRGKWVVVNFWATWCAPCLKEMPELSALHSMRENIRVVGLAYEETTPEALQAFLAERPVTYPVVIADPYAPPADFATPRGLPMTFLINPQGRVVHHFLGPVTAAQIEQQIQQQGADDTAA
jgi:thiol-disulfide isomerase/thioredoxin